MIECRYVTATGKLTGWCKDPNQFGNLERGKPTETVVELDIPNPSGGLDEWLFDGGDIIENPDYVKPSPPQRGYIGQLMSVTPGSVRPANVKRVWDGDDRFFDCFVTETVWQEYQSSDIVVGDYLWVEYLGQDEDVAGGETLVIAKIRKTW